MVKDAIDMRKSFIAGVLSLMVMPLISVGATNAQVNLYCLSLRFQPATIRILSQNYSLELTTGDPNSAEANGELAPLLNGGPSDHGCFYRLFIPSLVEPITGSFFVNVPPFYDNNTNGFHDFYEVSQAVGATTTMGTFDDGLGGVGIVTATWNRAANSKNGTCRLRLRSDFLDLTFNHTFEVLQFTGTLDYSVAGTNITGSVSLAQTMNSSNTLAGAAAFTRVDTNRLSLLAGSWTNAARQAIAYESSEKLDREDTRYFDFFFFADGELSTDYRDYVAWTIFISDPNDANNNGIPDLSDVAAPRWPLLMLSQANNQLLLSINGEIGRTHEVQQVSSLSQSNWTTTLSLTLTNSPQTVPLAAPTTGMTFWRVKVQ